MSSKIVTAVFLGMLCGCSSKDISVSDSPRWSEKANFANTSWEGHLDVKYAHAKAGPLSPLYVSIEMTDDSAILWLGIEKDKITAHRELRTMVRTSNYISLFYLVDSGGFTEEIKVAISPLSNGDADVQYLRIVNNYKRPDSHELRSFSAYAAGRLQVVRVASMDSKK